MSDELYVEWYDQPDILHIDDVVEQIENEYEIKLLDPYLETFKAGDKTTWIHEAVGWVNSLIDEFTALKEEIEKLES